MIKVKVISTTLDEKSEFKFGDILEVTKTYVNLPNTISQVTVDALPNCFEYLDDL